MQIEIPLNDYLDGVITVRSVSDWSSKQVPGIYKRLLDVQIH